MRLFQRINTQPLVNKTGVIYYVDPVAGNDNNTGTSPNAPWQTASKVNNGASYAGGGLSAGQSVLFKGGTSITGPFTFKLGANVASSSKSNPVLIGSYGSGDATILASTSGDNSYAVLLDGVSGITFTGLTVLANGLGCQYGIAIQNSVNSGGASGFNIIDCTASGFSGFNDKPSSEIYVATGNSISPTVYGVDDWNIINCVACGANGVTGSIDDRGISTQGFNQNLTNGLISGCTVYNIGGRTNGGYPGNESAGGSGDGILTAGCYNTIVQYCLVHDCGANTQTCGGNAANWTYSSFNTTIRYCESYNQRPWPTYVQGCDWEGFNLDGGSQGCVVEYCYSHDNAGPGFSAYVNKEGTGDWNNNTYRYNISVGDGYTCGDYSQGVLAFSSGDNSLGQPTAIAYVYNNTIINNVSGATYGSGGRFPNINFTPHTSMISMSDPYYYLNGGYMANNIFYQTPDQYGNTQFIHCPDGWQIDAINNAYIMTGVINGFQAFYNGTVYTTFASYQGAATGNEVNGFLSTADPHFNTSGTSGIASWIPTANTGPNSWGPTYYQITSSSNLLRGTGVALSRSPYNISIGGQDYYGNVPTNGVGTGINIGAYAG